MEAIIKMDIWDVKQTVYITEKENLTGFQTHSIDYSNVPDYLMSISDLTDVHVFGHEAFAKKLIEEIREKELSKYNANKINFYLNK